MKKFGWMTLLVLMLVLALAGSALAATTGLAVDGKVYTFSGELTSFEADGKTFIIEGIPSSSRNRARRTACCHWGLGRRRC